ncbi:hypothetical protein [Microlunatus soli]|uniref:Phosphotransferase enzyme family protein n=1 Tax=Microlunatus soli TaxID=630515 RepID=A0A1H1RU60_9ACTN|nr:hypothetical protein [Microlunatus soli]SDS39214.1 hypothetical protein SAMN04489812_1768 [Microlunatus soli]
MTHSDLPLGVRAARALRSGDSRLASQLVTPILESLQLGAVVELRFTSDEYSLNSVSGRVRFGDGPERFFKFHAEEGEDEHVGEYYRAKLLDDVGLPVDVPLAVRSAPGTQVALYEVREEPRMVDLCLDLERSQGATSAVLPDDLVRARRRLDGTVGAVAVNTLRPPTPSSAGAAIHQLFGHRLLDDDGSLGGTRFGAWYAANPIWQRVAAKRWQIGAVEYRLPLAAAVAEAGRLLSPGTLADGPVVTAHGDDHHGNVWCRRDPDGRPYLTLFDPAFAGDDLPALLALVKPTYHNALAHPFWLYHPADVADTPVQEDDHWVRLPNGLPISPLRQAVLDSIVDQAWAPLLRAMADRRLLPGNWRRTVRLAMMLCPLLVTDLLAPTRHPTVQLLGLAHAAAVSTEPATGTDPITVALDRLQSLLPKGIST